MSIIYAEKAIWTLYFIVGLFAEFQLLLHVDISGIRESKRFEFPSRKSRIGIVESHMNTRKWLEETHQFRCLLSLLM